MKTCMTSFPRSGALCSVAFAGALLLSACGKNEPPAPAPTPAPASTAPVAQAPVSPATSSALAPATAASIAVAASTLPPPTPFSVAKLTLGSAVNADGDHVVFKVAEVVEAGADATPNAKKYVEDTTRESVYQALLAGLKTDAGLRINPQVMNQLLDTGTIQ